MKTNTAATLYSRGLTSGSESWTRTAIAACFWENRKAANVIKSGMLEADSVSVYIPLATAPSIKVGDVLVKGAVTDTISPTFTMSALKAKYANVVVVKSVDLKDFGSPALQHVQIGAS